MGLTISLPTWSLRQRLTLPNLIWRWLTVCNIPFLLTYVPATVRIWFPFTYIHPLTKFPKHFGILWITVYNVTTNILELYLLLQNTLSQSEATEPPLLSSNSLSESRKYLAQNAFPMHSRGHLIPSPRLRASAAKNKLLWVVYTHKESYKVLGMFRNPCESPEGLSDDSQESLAFLLIP